MNSKTAPPLLAATGLSLTRKNGGSVPLRLEGMDLELHSGEFVLLTGASGSGKSSLMQSLARLIPLESGQLTLQGKGSAAIPPPLWRVRVSLVSAEPVMISGAIRENLLLPWQFKSFREIPLPEEKILLDLLEEMGLGELSLGADAKRLSSGQRERISLARHLLPQPDCLLLDEPVANLDRHSAARVWGVLERYREKTGSALLCVSHTPPVVKPDRILHLGNGGLTQTAGERWI